MSSNIAFAQPNNNTALYVVIALVSIICCFCILSSFSGLIYYMFFSEEKKIASTQTLDNVSSVSSVDDMKLKYGDVIQIKALAPHRFAGYDGFLTPCSTSPTCGTLVTVRNNQNPSEGTVGWDSKNMNPNLLGLRDWIIEGGEEGTAVNYESP